MISMALKFRQNPLLKAPPKYIPNAFIGATEAVLRQRVALILAKAIMVDVVEPPKSRSTSRHLA